MGFIRQTYLRTLESTALIMKMKFIIAFGCFWVTLCLSSCVAFTPRHTDTLPPEIVITPPLAETFSNIGNLRVHISRLDSSISASGLLELKGILINNGASDIVLPEASAARNGLSLTLNGCIYSPETEEVKLNSLWASLVFFQTPSDQGKVWCRKKYFLQPAIDFGYSVILPPEEPRPFRLYVKLFDKCTSPRCGRVKIRLGDGKILPYSNEVELFFHGVLQER